MSEEIKKLKPELLWSNFYSITQIPRPSKKEQKAALFVKEFGEKLGLETIIDKVGNVIIRKPATPGFENRKGIILQGHIDMVPQANSDSTHNFETDPIDAVIDGEWVRANGTTLGADNGIGVAAAMSVLQDNTLQHGPIEVLVTIDEETGMTGAFELQPGILKGDILINMDSEDEGELYVGCAGGINANARMSFDNVEVEDNTIAYQVKLVGLKGGHSGLDINLGRGNACKIMGRFLKLAVSKIGARLASISCGNLRNAIPREGFVVLTIPNDMGDKFAELVVNFEATLKNELGRVETSLSFTCEQVAMPETLIEEMVQDDLINGIQSVVNGAIRMSDSMPGVVESSTNLSIVRSTAENIEITCLVRGFIDSAKEDVASSIESTFRLAGAKVWLDGAYPGWKPNPDSDILKVMGKVYSDNWGKTPEIKAIHAGLECGILGATYPNWDMISFGPTIRYPHSPDEKVKIDTVAMFWNFLVETLKNAPVK